MEDFNYTEKQLRFLNKPLDSHDYSARSFNRLKANKIDTVGKLIKLDRSDLSNIRGLGEKSIVEILNSISENQKKFNSIGDLPEIADDQKSFETWLDSKEGQKQLITFYKEKETSIDALEKLSPRAYNLLSLNKITSIYMIIGKTADDLSALYCIDNITSSEIVSQTRRFLVDHKKELKRHFPVNTNADVSDSFFDIHAYSDKAQEYIRNNDLDLKDLRLSPRAFNALTNAGYYKLSEIAFLNDDDFAKLPGTGSKSIHEIRMVISSYLKKHQKRMKAYCLGDKEALIDDAYIHDQILSLYQNDINQKYDYETIAKLLLKDGLYTSERLKHVIGMMLSSSELEYIDGFCYRIYGKFESYYRLCPDLSERNKLVIQQRLEGKTLEEIGSLLNLTRERARQLINLSIKKIRLWYTAATGMKWFDEEYYMYLYCNYNISSKESEKWLGISNHTFNFLEMIADKKGRKDLNEALSDQNLDIGLRLKIRTFLNRNKIRIGEIWLSHKRSEVMEYVIRTQCKTDTKYSDFIIQYNDFCKKYNLPSDLYINDKDKKYIDTRLPLQRYLLWKQSMIFRFYDIDSRDYTELIAGIGLEDYQNIRYSTLKFIEDYPALMKKYDIHDQYELHNLLKKTIKEGSFHNIQFERMPYILFGNFNQDEAVRQLIRDHSPISYKDLGHLLHKIYGFDEKTLAANYLTRFSAFNYKGMYSVPKRIMSDEHAEMLKENLPDDFYFIDEIRDIYKKLSTDTDPNDIEPYNLKKIGFHVFSNYAIQHFENSNEYFIHILTKEEVYSAAPYRHRYGYINSFTTAIADLKNNLELFEFEPDEFVLMKRIEKAGFSKEDIRCYRDKVYAYVQDNHCFTIFQLKRQGFTSKLDELGFDDWFYGDVLSGDRRFRWSKMLGNIVLRKSTSDVTMGSFVSEIIDAAGNEGIDRYDLLDILKNKYGCTEPDNWKLIESVKSLNIYYDEVLDRFYQSADSYYESLDAGEHK